MTLPKFIFGMLLVAAAVAIWSIVDGAAMGTIVSRVIICAVVLQLGYFLFVLLMVQKERSVAGSQPDIGREAAKEKIAAAEQKLHRP